MHRRYVGAADFLVKYFPFNPLQFLSVEMFKNGHSISLSDSSFPSNAIANP